MSKEALIRLAATLPAGSSERKAVLAAAKTANAFSDMLKLMEKRLIAEERTMFGGRLTDQYWLNGWRSGLDILWPCSEEIDVASRFEFDAGGRVAELVTFIMYDEESIDPQIVVEAYGAFRPRIDDAGQISLDSLDRKKSLDWPADPEEFYAYLKVIVEDYAKLASIVKNVRI